MSEAEKKRRFDYKQNRSKWIRIQALIIAIVLLVAILFAATYYNTSKNYYINYTESGNVDYDVFLKDNDFYENDRMDDDLAYIASLIDKVVARFSYDLNMEEEVNYSYSYKVNAAIEVVEKNTGRVVFRPTYELIPEETIVIDGAQKSLSIDKRVEIEYDTYNDRVKEFINTYSLKDYVRSYIVLEMEIEVISACESFDAENSRNDYVVSLNIPLTEQMVDIEMRSSVPEEETKILACTDNKYKTLLLVLTIVFVVITLLLVAFLIAFIILTRTTDINYTIKVNKILSNYKSYIQQIVSPFDSTGYQILLLANFTEMLELRDTLQSPILMNENDDKTCTRFIIPTHTKILYVYEIKVDDYDEIYGEDPIITDELPDVDADIITDELPVIEVESDEEKDPEMEEETVILMENVDEEELAEAIAAPSIPLSKIDYDMDDDEDEEEGVEVIGVVWPERPTHNKVYRYDPNGERVTNGDIVLVPSRDAARNRNIIRKATVAHGNHKVDPEHLKHPLKKIIGIVKRKAETALMPKEDIDPQANGTDTPEDNA